MEVKLEKRYPLQASVAQAWMVLRDVTAVANCMPGASITQQVDATHYKGAVKVKLGPAVAAFAGDIEVLLVDAAALRTQLLGKGADKSGSTASMNLTATVEAGDAPGQCVLMGDAVVIVNGKFAQFGGRMMVQVSDMILAQFAANFNAAAAAQVVDTAMPVGAPDASTALPTIERAAAAVAADTAAASASAATTSKPMPAVPAVPAPPVAQEINALAIAWGLVRNWVAGLFGRRT